MSGRSAIIHATKKLPDRLFHGTNIEAAIRILNDECIEATEPVDGDFSVVCTTSKYRIGRAFAIEFMRTNSSMPVGVVFKIATKNLHPDIEFQHIHAATASFDECEYRLADSVVLAHITGIQCVGATHLLRSRRYLEGLHEERFNGMKWSSFERLVGCLVSGRVE